MSGQLVEKTGPALLVIVAALGIAIAFLHDDHQRLPAALKELDRQHGFVLVDAGKIETARLDQTPPDLAILAQLMPPSGARHEIL